MGLDLELSRVAAGAVDDGEPGEVDVEAKVLARN